MENKVKLPESELPRIVIVGGGFGGLALAKSLANTSYQVVLIDKHNYHTFQPLLYQVATGALEPDSIASPFRSIFEKKKNVFFRLAEVEQIVPEKNSIQTTIGDISYDYLVLCTGSKTNYFNMDGVSKYSMPLKSVPDALDLRSMLLQNLEKALNTEGEELESLVDIIVVGGGPTGIETAGALAELKNHVLPDDYAEIDFKRMDIYLLEMGPRLLAGMSEKASEKTKEYLEKLGVIVLLNTGLKSYDGENAVLSNGNTIPTKSLIYTAGVTGNLVNGLPNTSVSKGRIMVDPYLRVKDHNNIFAIGDIAAIQKNQEMPHPMVAQVAMQQGKYLAKQFKKKFASPQPFKYVDLGSMATIGKNKAVVDFAFAKFQGFFAWLMWIFIHIMHLVGFRNRIVVFINWASSYFNSDKRFRLIIRPFASKSSVKATH